jgi:hypothetical protein
MNIKYISLFLVLGIVGLNATTISEEFDKSCEEYVQKVQEYNECGKSHPFFSLIACRQARQERTLKQIAYEQISNEMKSYCDKEIQQAEKSNAGVDVDTLYRRAMDNARADIEEMDKYAKYGISFKNSNSKVQGIKAGMQWRASADDIAYAREWHVAGGMRDAKILPSYSTNFVPNEIFEQAVARAGKTIDTICDATFIRRKIIK